MASMSTSAKRGYDITPNERVVANYTTAALVRGDVVQFDIQQTHASTTNSNKARDNSSKVNVVFPETAVLKHAVFAVCLESISATLGTEGKVAVQGDHLPIKVDGAAAAGAALIPVNGAAAATDTAGAIGEKIIGRLDDALAGAGVGTCDFDGLDGLGSSAVS